MLEIDIRPPSDVYETFGRLSYKPWYAIAEFVDNATQNFFDHRSSLAAANGGDARLTVSVDYDGAGPSLRIQDDAHGMGLDEFRRAMRLNERPPDQSGRSEFGMGLKTAACWFGSRWTLESTRLGESLGYRATLDLEELQRTRPDTLMIEEFDAAEADHGTTLTIDPLRRALYGRSIQRVKETLASMYRFDIAREGVKIVYNGDPLEWNWPPLWREELPDGTERVWRHDLDLAVEDPQSGAYHRITGWAGILETMSARHSGFALFRRERLIIGGPTEGWRPQEVMGSQGSHSWKRLVGELHLDDFPVSFSKDGFRWEGALEERTIEAVAEAITDYRRKAANIRVRSPKVRPEDLEAQTRSIESALKPDELRRDLARHEAPFRPKQDPVDDPSQRESLLDDAQGPLELRVPVPSGDLVARVYLKSEDSRVEWLTLSFAQPDEVDVFLNTNHPFVAEQLDDERSIGLLQRFALSLALAEKRARMLGEGRIWPDDLRTHLDTFLKHFTGEGS